MTLFTDIKKLREDASMIDSRIATIRQRIIAGIKKLPDLYGKPIDWSYVSAECIVVNSANMKYSWSPEYYIFKKSYDWMISEIERSSISDIQFTIDAIKNSNEKNKIVGSLFVRMTSKGKLVQIHEDAVNNFKTMMEDL